MKRFQKFAKLNETGTFDPATWEKLKKLYDPQGYTLSAVSPEVEYRSPSLISTPLPPEQVERLSIEWPPQGTIAILQKALILLGYDVGYPDDSLNSRTRSAIRQFQLEHGIKADGKLQKETVFAILNKQCRDGCYYPVTIQSDSKIVSDDSDVPMLLTGKNWETIFIKGFKKVLYELGYNVGSDHTSSFDATVQQAVRQFQRTHHLEETGEFDDVTISSIFWEGCQSGCNLVIAVNMENQPIRISSTDSRKYDDWKSIDENGNLIISNPSEQTAHSSDEETFRRIDPTVIKLDYSFMVGDNVFAVEKAECSDISGDWIIFYEGLVTDKDSKAVAVRLEKRFGYRYRPDQEGVDNTDWWCVPARRHCYSEIKFSDWGGKYFPNQTVRFSTEDVYNSRIGIINGLSLFLQEKCHR